MSNKAKVWLGFFIIVSLMAAIIGFLPIFFQLNPSIGLAVGIGTWLLLVVITLVKGYVNTPHMHEDIVEFMGQYVGAPLKPGPHILFPYLGLEIIVSRVFMGEQKLALYLDEKEGNSGDVEFQDCSASLKAFFFFQIYDSEKAAYDIDNILGALEEKAEHILRAFFGSYTLDDAIAMKTYFHIENVASLLDVSSDSPNRKLSQEEFAQLNVSKEEAEKTNFYVTLNSWGVAPKSFAISDIETPKYIKEQRSRVLIADKDMHVAKIDNLTAAEKAKKTVIEAKAEKSKLRIIGEGRAQALKAVVDKSGLAKEAIADYLVQTAKWEALGKNAHVTIIEDGGGKVSDGVKIGVGIGAVAKKEKEEKIKNKEDKK